MITLEEGRALADTLRRLADGIERNSAKGLEKSLIGCGQDIQAVGLAVLEEQEVKVALDAPARLWLQQHTG